MMMISKRTNYDQARFVAFGLLFQTFLKPFPNVWIVVFRLIPKVPASSTQQDFYVCVVLLHKAKGNFRRLDRRYGTRHTKEDTGRRHAIPVVRRRIVLGTLSSWLLSLISAAHAGDGTQNGVGLCQMLENPQNREKEKKSVMTEDLVAWICDDLFSPGVKTVLMLTSLLVGRCIASFLLEHSSHSFRSTYIMEGSSCLNRIYHYS